MMKYIRYIIAILALSVLLIGMGFPAMASISDNPAKSIEISEKGKGHEDPWDPGDECVPFDKSRFVDASNSRIVVRTASCDFEPDMLIVKRGEDPWDPGDESDRKMEVCHA